MRGQAGHRLIAALRSLSIERQFEKSPRSQDKRIFNKKRRDFFGVNPLNPPYQGDFKRKYVCPQYLSNSRYRDTTLRTVIGAFRERQICFLVSTVATSLGTGEEVRGFGYRDTPPICLVFEFRQEATEC